MTVSITLFVRQALHATVSHIVHALVLVPLTCSLAGCGEKTSAPVSEPRPVRFILAPEPTTGSSVMMTGEIQPHDQITLGFRLSGRIISRQVDIGDRVHAGESLAMLENENSRNQLISAQADLESMLAAEHLAALNLERMKQLMPAGAISRQQFDTTKSDWQSAVSRRKSSEAALNNAKETLSWANLKAPEDGIITSVSASPGQVISEGQTVVTLATTASRDAVFDVADPQLFTAKAQGQLEVSLLSDPSVHVSGTLRDIGPQADPQTRTWRLRVTLNNPPVAMNLGSSVQGRLNLPGQSSTQLPASSLTSFQNSPAVLVVDPKTHLLHMRQVVIERFTVDDIYVKAGIAAGDRVVTAGVSNLRENEKVSFGDQKQ